MVYDEQKFICFLFLEVGKLKTLLFQPMVGNEKRQIKKAKIKLVMFQHHPYCKQHVVDWIKSVFHRLKYLYNWSLVDDAVKRGDGDIQRWRLAKGSTSLGVALGGG